MTDRKQALTELLAKVEAGGEIGHHDTIPLVRAWRSPLEYFDITYELEAAYNGSLDAALALHNAVLGGWTWQKMPDGTIHLMCQDTFRTASGHTNHNPARAWLIAIIKALIAQEDAQ